VILRHEALQLQITQIRTFTAQGLGEQEARSAFQKQRRRVELDELHIADFCAGAIGHSDAIAGGHSGVRSVAVNVAQASGGKQYRTGVNVVELS